MECEHCFSVVANGHALRSHCYRSHRTARQSPAYASDAELAASGLFRCEGCAVVAEIRYLAVHQQRCLRHGAGGPAPRSLGAASALGDSDSDIDIDSDSDSGRLPAGGGLDDDDEEPDEEGGDDSSEGDDFIGGGFGDDLDMDLDATAPLLPPVPVPPAGAAPEKHLEVGSHFMSPLPVGRDWSLQRRSIGSRSTSEKNFHKFELAALEEQDGSTGYDRTAVLFHHTDCGCGIFCYSPYDEARAACTTNSVIRQPFRKVIELSAVAGPIDSAVRSRDSARDTSTPIHTIHSSHVHQHHTPRTSTDFRPTHNRGTQGKPGIGVKPEINPGSGCE